MNLSALTPANRGAEIPLEELANHSALSEKDKLAQVSRQFEAALLRQILADARKPVFASKLTEKSAVSGIYDGMVTEQLADSISRSGEFGLASSLQQQLNRSVEPASASLAAGTIPASLPLERPNAPESSGAREAEAVRMQRNFSAKP